MAKGKDSIPNKSLHSRVSYLYQAAAFLASQKQHSSRTKPDSGGTITGNEEPHNDNTDTTSSRAAARHLIKDLRAVSLKAQLRMSPAMKNTICKNCDTMLMEGSTCSTQVENRSKGGKKPWADVLVLKCTICGSAKRFPLAAPRQKRRTQRAAKETVNAQDVKGD